MARRNVTLEIRAKNALQRGLASAGKQLQAFGQSAARIGKFFAKSFLAAGAAVVGFGLKAISAHARQEKALMDLTSALNAYGDDSAALMPTLKAQADAIQDETSASNDQTLAKMAQLRVLGVMPEKLGSAYKGVIALEQAGVGLNTALRAASAAMQGNFEMLTRYIPALRNANTEGEKAALVNDFMMRGYMTAQDRLDTVSGRWEQLKNRIDDAWKEMGAAIAQNDLLTDALHRAGEAVKRFGEGVRRWVESGGVTRLIYGFRVFYEDVRHRFQLIGNAAHIAFSALGDSFETAWNYIKGVAVSGGNLVVGNFRRIGSVATAVFRAMRERSRESFAGIRDAVKDATDSSIADLKDMGRALAGENTATTRRTVEAMQQREAYQQSAAKRMAATEAWYTSRVAKDAETRVKANREAGEAILGDDARIAAERAALEKQRADTAKQLADAEKKAAGDAVKAIEDQIKAREELAKKTVEQFMAERDADKAGEQAMQADIDRAKKLRDKQDRGITLSRRDREFLQAFEEIEAARKAGDDGALERELHLAQKQLEEMAEQTKTLAELRDEMKDLNKSLDGLLRAQ